MKRPSYAVVSYSLLALTLFGFAVEGLRHKIPEPAQNRLRFETSEFLVQGSRSEVDWRTLEPSAFAEARRTGRPILLLIGAPWSRHARDADAFVFSDREVVSFLNRYMVCIRIDGQSDPKWLSAFLPVRRPSLPMVAGFQVWFLTPEGQLFHDAASIGTRFPSDPDEFGQILIEAREELRAMRSGDPMAPEPGSEQAQDRSMLVEGASPSPLQEVALLQEAREIASLGLGGRVRFSRVQSVPQILRYLLLSGRHREFRQIADAMIRSPLVDWLEGGFFRSYYAAPPVRVEYDKHALENAQLMAVLAMAGRTLDEPIYTRLAQRTFDCLTREFVQNGLISGAQMGGVEIHGRSPRYSFSPKQLRDVLTSEERDIAREGLNLQVDLNRSMTPWVSDPRSALDQGSAVAAVLEKLRSVRTEPAEFACRRQLDIHGYVVARLLECARLWGDMERLLAADELYSRLEWFLAGDDVRHSLQPGISDEPYLGDYLAFADAALHSYLALSRVDALETGLRVLKRARFLYETGTPGVWKLAYEPKVPLGPQNVDVPEILDLVRESCTAQAMRLCVAYGRILGDTAMQQEAQSCSAQFSGVMGSLGGWSAGALCAALLVQDDASVLVSGANASLVADRIFREVPTRLVAPLMGIAEKAHGVRTRGIYLWKNGRISGPDSETEAVRAVSAPLSLGP